MRVQIAEGARGVFMFGAGFRKTQAITTEPVKYPAGSSKEEWKIKDWVLWQRGDCPPLEFDFFSVTTQPARPGLSNPGPVGSRVTQLMQIRSLNRRIWQSGGST